MSEWMNYMHMQKDMPANVRGVPVILTATAPDGSAINIGQTTSDGYGYFQFLWTPPSTGNYKIQATFAGSESYWSSTAQTGLSVSAASPSISTSPSANTGTTAPSPSSQTASSLIIYIAAVIAVIVIVAPLTALILRRRK
jgi:signal transduction histidine kinase